MITNHLPYHASHFAPSAMLRLSSADVSRRAGRSVGRSLPRSPLWRLESPAASRGLPWSLFLLGVFLLVLAVAGGFLYVREITSTAVSGYDISALERRSEDLRAEESRLQLEAAELQSLKRIEGRLPKLNLVPTSAITYTSPLLDGALTGQIPVGIARQ